MLRKANSTCSEAEIIAHVFPFSELGSKMKDTAKSGRLTRVLSKSTKARLAKRMFEKLRRNTLKRAKMARNKPFPISDTSIIFTVRKAITAWAAKDFCRMIILHALTDEEQIAATL